MKKIIGLIFLVSCIFLITFDTAMSSEPHMKNDPSTSKLSSLQCSVTRDGATEPPFQNAYWDNHREGIYVDVVSGEPLFSSTDKFDSGSGWPSFTQPLIPENIVEKKDLSYGMARTEVKSLKSGSHLGHVFNDGPAPSKTRFCINSAALRFIPKDDLKVQGYEEYLKLFQN